MTNEKCPYCGAEISDTDNICPNCAQNLVLKCPFCKQEIKAYDEVCPHCSSALCRKKEPKVLFYIGYALSAIWIILNLLVLWGITTVPEIVTMRDEEGYLAFPLSSYMSLVLQPMIIISIPYIMAAVKKYKTMQAYIWIIINLMFGIGFLGYFIHLQRLYL